MVFNMLSGHGCKKDKGSSTIPIIEGNPKPFQILVFKTTYSSIVGHFIVVDFMDKKCNNASINEHFTTPSNTLNTLHTILMDVPLP
jgi:hypothetical protein